MQIFEIVITPDFQGQRMDKALTALLSVFVPALSRARVQALMAQGHVRCQKFVCQDTSQKVKSGDVYYITLPPVEAAEPEAQVFELDILYEDRDLLVLNKPAGMVVHPAPGNRDRTLVNALLAHCGSSLSGIGGVARPGIVHRLDKDTSGLMVVAKNDEAHQSLAKQFASRTLSRTYQALVWGADLPARGSIEGSIGRHGRDRKRMAVTAKGKPALTHFKVLEGFRETALVECKLATGRTHQIRVHMAHIKHPVVGDPLYGRRRVLKDMYAFPRQALHAVRLQFIHPRTHKTVEFSSSLPVDMQLLIKKCRKDMK